MFKLSLILTLLLSFHSLAKVSTKSRFEISKEAISRLAEINDFDGTQRYEGYTTVKIQKFTDVYETKTETESLTYTDKVCPKLSGDGSQGNWGNYFSSPVDKRASALEGVIKGLGPATSQFVVDELLANNNKKPRSWDEFKTLIEKANKNKPGIYHRVIIKHGEHNLKSLGYKTQDCQNISVTQFHEVEVTDLVDSIPGRTLNHEVRVIITNAPILKDEVEKFSATATITEDSFGQVFVQPKLSVTKSFNKYEFFYDKQSNDRSIILIKGKGRKKFTLSKDHLDITLTKKSLGLYILVNNKIKEFLDQTGGHIEIVGEVQEVGLINSTKKENIILKLSESSEEFDLDFEMIIKDSAWYNPFSDKKEDKFVFKYKARVIGNKFFSDKLNRATKTDKVSNLK